MYSRETHVVLNLPYVMELGFESDWGSISLCHLHLLNWKHPSVRLSGRQKSSKALLVLTLLMA